MDADRFDALTRVLTGAASSRRRLLTGTARSTLATLAAALGAPDIAANQFGCRNVGKPCKRDGHCCSSRCRDNLCKAHHVGGCTAEENFCTIDRPACGTGGFSCACYQTTGGASYCSEAFAPFACTTDAQCVKEFGDRGAACVDFTGCNAEGGTQCAFPCES